MFKFKMSKHLPSYVNVLNLYIQRRSENSPKRKIQRKNAYLISKFKLQNTKGKERDSKLVRRRKDAMLTVEPQCK